MSNLTREAIVDSLCHLTNDQEVTLQSSIDTLTRMKNSKIISESNLRDLINVWRELDSLRELFYMRLMNSLKRGDMIRD